MAGLQIPIDADVYAGGEMCGRSSHVIVNPANQQVTHIVVKEGLFGAERVVPLEFVTETTSNQIQLGCSREEFGSFGVLSRTEFVTPKMPFQSYTSTQVMMWPYVTPTPHALPTEQELIPPEKLAIRRGARVEATDGTVGQVDQFIVEPVSGYISHLVIETDGLWNRKQVTVPASSIDQIDQKTVVLALDRQTIENLPNIETTGWEY